MVKRQSVDCLMIYIKTGTYTVISLITLELQQILNQQVCVSAYALHRETAPSWNSSHHSFKTKQHDLLFQIQVREQFNHDSKVINLTGYVEAHNRYCLFRNNLFAQQHFCIKRDGPFVTCIRREKKIHRPRGWRRMRTLKFYQLVQCMMDN